jgi:hypothetical protein
MHFSPTFKKQRYLGARLEYPDLPPIQIILAALSVVRVRLCLHQFDDLVPAQFTATAEAQKK